MSKNAKFDRTEVVGKATNLYWEKGYHGTSMRNLQTAIDLRPGSIYATFGSKDNLFKEALNHYAENTANLLTSCISEAETPLSGLKLFIKKIIVDNRDTAPSNMCMIVKSISELTESDNKELLAEATSLLNNVEIKFADIINEAIKLNEIADDKDPLELARYVQVQIIGLRTYSRVVKDKQAIEKFIEQIFLGSPFH
ncbi:TetR/AcrR family transcriptional regulator [Psychromonas sp. RZ22]|uniref:TetR/AcrR family transcriptional regulator n=1 Tax=Psychromonas algarum TaxID=2555643 RepID=UPI00106775BF|nr:TetR/AcrR family transcriptional regulator [Psychromonas sp. RZ22]TEW55230.1 TetR/AcrR family transcriptional regulator [Psychromonas sp. RZ22]